MIIRASPVQMDIILFNIDILLKGFSSVIFSANILLTDYVKRVRVSNKKSSPPNFFSQLFFLAHDAFINVSENKVPQGAQPVLTGVARRKDAVY